MVLFADDFDAPQTPATPEPAVAEAALAEAALAEAAPTEPAAPDPAVLMQQAYDAGYQAGRAQTGAEQDDVAQRLAAALADGLMHLDEAVASRADAAANAIGRLAIGLLCATLPASFERFGTAEAVRFAKAVLPGLAEEPEISVTACPSTLPALQAATARMATEMAGRITIAPSADLPQGALRIAWPGGVARRDPAALTRRVRDVLGQFGLDTPANAAALEWEAVP
jgi:hypothetical protein